MPRHRLLITRILLELLVLAVAMACAQSWYDPAWLHRKKITIDHTKVPSTQTDYPVMVRIAGDSDIATHTRYDARDILFTASDGTTKLAHELVNSDPILIDHAFFTYACSPIAIHYNDSTYMGWQNTAGDIVIGRYVHGTQTFTTFTLHAGLIPDHHNTPALWIRTDGKILVVYTQHGTSGVVYQRISTNAEDITAWGSETTYTDSLPTTYTILRYLSGENGGAGRLYHFFRVTDAGTSPATDTWRFRTSDNEGTTWSGATSFFSGGSTTHNYTFPAIKNTPTRLHFAADNNNVGTWAADSSTGRPNVYHFYMDVSSGSRKWYKSDGTEITASLPIGTAQATLVYDGTTTVGFALAATIDGSGNPLIAYTTYPGATATWAHHQNVTRWTGSTWVSAEVVNTGGPVAIVDSYPPASAQPQDTTGIAFDDADEDSVYVGVQVSTDTWTVKKYTWNGSAWSETATISARHGKHHYFVSPVNYDSGLQLLWLEGYYEYYAQNGSGVLLEDTRIFTYPRIVSAANLFLTNVKVPTLASSADTDLYLYYGNASATDQSDPTAVWDSNYLGVWHGNNCATDGTKICDSTSNARHFTKPSQDSLTAPHEYAGKTGLGQRFSHNTANDEASAGTSLNLANTTALTWECWLYYASQSGTDSQILLENVASGQNTSGFTLRIGPTSTNRLLGAGIYQTDTNVTSNPTDLLATVGAWNWIVATYDSSVGIKLWLNNTASSTTTSTSGAAFDAGASGTLYMGRRNPTANGYLTANGILEECRVSNIVRSTDWRTVQYNNYNSPTTFLTLDAQEDTPATGSGGRGLLLLIR